MKGHELSLDEFFSSKVHALDALLPIIKKEKDSHKTIATLNGSFDLLHAGHLYILFEAAKVADILIVALNSDASIKRYKSPKRPIVPLKYRMQMMASVQFVDYVTFFEEDDPRALIEAIKPHVHVNGAEYGTSCIESDVVQKVGGKLHLVPKIDGLSTTTLIQTITTVCAS